MPTVFSLSLKRKHGFIPLEASDRSRFFILLKLLWYAPNNIHPHLGSRVIGVARLPDVIVVDQNIRVLLPDVPVGDDTDITGLAPPSVLVVQAGIGVRSARYGACSGIVARNNAEVHSATARDK